MHKLSHNALPVPDNLSEGNSQILMHGRRNSLREKITHNLEIHHKKGLSDSPSQAHSAVFDFPHE